ncbi:Protein mago nashi 2 [Blastocladiella emersonii ATCC 22665]|nr:Protein mago nashi 2 [Blastocladiella emersonii ATCC 22665]
MPAPSDFFFRYYVGHTGRYGHEFLEFEVHASGKLRYINNSNYKNDSMIKKEVFISPILVEEICRIIEESTVVSCDDSKWPEPNIDGKQELELVMGKDHLSFTTCKINSLADVAKAEDQEGLRNFYYMVQDIKALVFSVISLHFKIKPI